MQDYAPLALTPEQYELEVKADIDALGLDLADYQSKHREVLPGVDGEYEIDITVRFSALGVDFLTLIESKYYKRAVGREKVQALHAKLQSTGAHKGLMFSTSGFQSGAVEYATVHGIGLVEFVDGRTSYIRRSFGETPIPWEQVPGSIPKIVGWLRTGQRRSLVSTTNPEALRSFISNVQTDG